MHVESIGGDNGHVESIGGDNAVYEPNVPKFIDMSLNILVR